jgi:hypothetical protein
MLSCFDRKEELERRGGRGTLTKWSTLPISLGTGSSAEYRIIFITIKGAEREVYPHKGAIARVTYGTLADPELLINIGTWFADRFGLFWNGITVEHLQGSVSVYWAYRRRFGSGGERNCRD